MYVCGSCRGAAVTSMEPGLVCILERGPLNYISLNVLATVGWDIDVYLAFKGKALVQQLPLHARCRRFLFPVEVLINLL